VTSLPTETLTPPASGDLFAASGGLVLDNQLPAGTYVLEIAAASTDPSRAGKARTAVQRLSFDVR
jgi:hypothetical protein